VDFAHPTYLQIFLTASLPIMGLAYALVGGLKLSLVDRLQIDEGKVGRLVGGFGTMFGPTILLCPHFVCLDVAGVATMFETSLCSIYVQQKNAAFDEVLRQVKEIPGVEAAGITDALPLGRNRTWGAGAKGVTYERGKFPFAFPRIVSDGYSAAMGIPLLAGRDIAESDTARMIPR